MRRLIAQGALLLALAGAPTTTALAAGNPSGTGQPNQECEEQPSTPGNAAFAPGSPFNEDGVAGGKYAGEQPQNSKNPKSVSQYDVACFHVSQR